MERVKTSELLKRVGKKTPRDMLCFKSLAFCCGLKKPCLKRDLYMKIYSIPKKDFSAIKKECSGWFELVSKPQKEEIEIE